MTVSCKCLESCWNMSAINALSCVGRYLRRDVVKLLLTEIVNFVRKIRGVNKVRNGLHQIIWGIRYFLLNYNPKLASRWVMKLKHDQVCSPEEDSSSSGDIRWLWSRSRPYAIRAAQLSVYWARKDGEARVKCSEARAKCSEARARCSEARVRCNEAKWRAVRWWWLVRVV